MIFIFKVVKINVSLIILFLVTGISFCGSIIAVGTSLSERKLPIYSVETQDKKIAVTFDAAWEANDTDQLIAILKKHNAKATIFCLGDWAKKNPQAVLKFHKAGHEIGNHSYSHPLFSRVSGEKTKEELQLCNEEIKKITGTTPKICRAPSGDYNNESLEICEKMNMKMIQWDCDSLDWKKLSVDEMYSRITSKVQNGSILLFHNGVENTPEALDKILTKLEKDGYEFVTVSELIYWDNYEIEHTGRQVKV